MSVSGADLLTLQGNIKRDPLGYSDEFQLQWRHYKACLQLFLLKPSQEGSEFGDLVNFIAQVSSSYPKFAEDFSKDLMELLDRHHAVLEPGLRQTLVKALILLRNRQQLSPTVLLPLLFRLFRVQDKALRQLVFRHVTADIKNSNKRGRNERLNRAVQNFMYSVIQDEHEGAAKKGLAVLTEMWRRHVWRDVKTVNVIAAAALHKSSRIMLASLKFFLGQDAAEAEKGDGSDSDDEERPGAQGPSREDVYSAFHKGTTSSKKKKQKKLKRVQAAVKRAERKQEGTRHESFAALQLLHDPQGWAEKLFRRLQGGRERFEARIALVNVVSRAVGVHKLLLLNFYPFLQKYINPSQRDVTVILAALVQACHELVPPETLAPVLRQLVDQFVHDRARPEVMTIGIKSVREICTRCPLVMTPELLQDLTAYKKFRNKEVSSAARSLIGLFRELAPGMLEKRDRGRGADLGAGMRQYGAAQIATRIEGAELLEQALREGRFDSDGELISESEGEEEEEEEGSEDEEGNEEEGGGSSGGEEAAELGSDDDDEEEEGGSGSEGEDEEAASSSGEDGEDEEDEQEEDGRQPQRRSKRGAAAAAAEQAAAKRPKKAPQQGSIAQLKKQLAAAKGGDEAAAAAEDQGAVPLEWGRILTEEDFDKIRQLKHRRLVESAMQKHGLKSASKRERARAAAEEEAGELLALKERLAVMHEERLNPDDLLGRHKYRKDKEERMKSVLEGREGREFGAKSSLKKKKTGGLSNREKDKRKRLPMAARSGQVKKRLARHKSKKSAKNFKGHARN
ncbi:hypothetical protein ABPG75_009074 [Micractinium tetrahymenae]